jgi:hypothetical protein
VPIFEEYLLRYESSRNEGITQLIKEDLVR